MKSKFFTLALFMSLFIQFGKAQSTNYTPFEWDILRFGYVLPGGVEKITGGYSLGTEIRYNYTNRSSLGLRYELAFFGTSGDIPSISGAGSWVVMFDKYFTQTSSHRAFWGVGLGSFKGATIDTYGGTSFGLVPRFGLELGHIRLSGEYNYTIKKEVSDYFSINLGITLWGGYKG